MERNDVPNVNFFIGYAEKNRKKNFKNEKEEQSANERKFYSCNQENDYVHYVNSGSNEKVDFVAYSGNEEKSHGLFNQNGLMNKEDVKELRTKLRKTNSVIWHGVISFTEEFGNRYCNTTEKAIKLMKRVWPKFLKEAGLNPDNIIWYAGLHENTDNKHIHFSFFEMSPLRQKQNHKRLSFSDGFIPINAINNTKVLIERSLLDIQDEIILGRKTLTEELKRNIQTGVFMKKIKLLVGTLPSEGRMQYDSENLKDYKSDIDSVVTAIIKSDKEMDRKFKAFDELLTQRDIQVAKAYSKIKVDCSNKLIRNKCLEDLYRRLGNVVIRAVKDIRREQSKFAYETKSRLIQKHIEKKRRQVLLKECIKLNELVNREMIDAFQEYREKLEVARYTILKEEGYLD